MFYPKLIIAVVFLLTVLLFENKLSAGESSTYNFSWLDPDKEVYVLQNKKYRKDKKAHLSAGYGMTTNGAFVDATSLQGRVGFFFTEEWGMEFLYAQNSGEENENFQSVLNIGGPGSTPFRRIVENYLGAMVLWSPFYAKVNTFNSIVYVDWMVGLGYGQLNEKNNREVVRTGTTGLADVKESHNAIMWGTGLKFYLSPMFHIRLDLTAMHYSALRALTVKTSDDEGNYENFDLTLALGINLF
ncbi:MAG: hypothetical protein A2504_05485 [Bdellovibrionales bacterium RIFOXYD12_FULL_39_22]|nr:MAG: hypothetical protein A2385_06340 [Bdellovibrionales bacterium RIFOXYB1_FULL_39_21]OFZ41897.1 MAG: hypothetical protein A2485_08310 [Bdellovibrionales bacterium RIFOXYC12_FULL_39_17]OFZ50613.1 MAG: hypothetical protein A2404_05260 [Bdellovibrionales bacterium RIFOXYC1_FULL_39_130]OFZ71345.1 MAG: hypothetical protein A2451_05760 [Bdellovibrionales bacterium RIFOXYC2_FULL_39_8]OFZ77836.1 MAG: hypothetical protein A2560_00430 [Bdellovibrionales bacterium RIFOXYD1_FULL_39_84]OFZ93728.1 MAG: